MNYSIRKDNISLCDKDACLHLKGDTAKVISAMLALFTLVAITSAMAKAIR